MDNCSNSSNSVAAGLLGGNIGGGFVHLLLVIALIVIAVNVLQGSSNVIRQQMIEAFAAANCPHFLSQYC